MKYFINLGIAFLCAFISINKSRAQKIVNQKAFDIPKLGNNGSQNPLYLSIDKSDGLIYFYATGHQNGDLWTVGKNDYQAYLTKHSKKTGVGKQLDNMLIGNAYQSQIFLNTYELKLTKDLEQKGSSRMYFRQFGPKSDTLLFLSNFGNIVSLDPVSKQITGREGEIRSHIDDFNKFFRTVPKVNDTVSVLYNINLKGEGAFGFKNMAPWLEKTSYYNQYNPLIGFLPNSNVNHLFNFKNIEEIKDGDYVLESFYNPTPDYMSAWFIVDATDRKDKRHYKMIVFNSTGKALKSFDYKNEFSKRPIFTNKEVFDQHGNLSGSVSLFGYDFDSDKKYLSTDKNKLTEFDVFYFNPKGELIWKTTLSHGDEKNYKHALEPTTVFFIDNKLVFLNSNRKSIFNIDYEVISLTDKGEKQILLNDESNTVFSKTEYVNKYIPEKGNVVYDGKNFWKYGFTGDRPEGQLDFIYRSMSIVKFDKDFKPIIKKIIPISPSKKVEPTLALLSNIEGAIKYLLLSGGKYSILTFGENGVDNQEIKSDLFNGCSTEAVTAFGKSYIIDKENKIVYLMHQGYTNGNSSNTLMLNKILLTKISY